MHYGLRIYINYRGKKSSTSRVGLYRVVIMINYIAHTPNCAHTPVTHAASLGYSPRPRRALPRAHPAKPGHDQDVAPVVCARVLVTIVLPTAQAIHAQPLTWRSRSCTARPARHRPAPPLSASSTCEPPLVFHNALRRRSHPSLTRSGTVRRRRADAAVAGCGAVACPAGPGSDAIPPPSRERRAAARAGLIGARDYDGAVRGRAPTHLPVFEARRLLRSTGR